MPDNLIAVTGANGWLGLNLIEALRDADRSKSCHALILKGTSTKELKNLSPEIEIKECDITDKKTLDGLFDNAITIFHCAGIIHSKRTGNLFRINTLGTKNVLNAAIEQGARRIIHISSNSVMGFNLSREGLFTEDMPCKPYMKYGRSKYLAELAVKEAQASGKIETVILRPCWYYGKYQPERQTTFFGMIKSGKPVMFGNGENLRSITCLPNLVDAMLAAEESEKAPGQTYWIADKQPNTMNEVYKTIAKVLEVEELTPRHLPNFASALCRLADRFFQFFTIYHSKIHVGGEMNRHIACSVDKAIQELDYRPRVTFEEGVRISVDWCRSNNIEI